MKPRHAECSTPRTELTVPINTALPGRGRARNIHEWLQPWAQGLPSGELPHHVLPPTRTRAPMPQSNVTLRPSDLFPEGAATAIASAQRAGRADAAADELELPLSASPPLSLASSQPAEALSGSGVSLRLFSDLDEVAAEWKAVE